MHRSQITFDYLGTESGQVKRGRIGPADRLALRSWLARVDGAKDVHFVVEGCTGWRFVVEECAAAGVTAHLADPAETAAARGKKRRAKTDKLDARHPRQLLVEARLPEAWVPPTEVQEWRAKVRLHKDLGNERTDWMQRVRATWFHQGLPARRSVSSPEGRADLLVGEGLSPAGAQQVTVAVRQIARLDGELAALHNEICAFGRGHAGCRALWVGPLRGGPPDFGNDLGRDGRHRAVSRFPPGCTPHRARHHGLFFRRPPGPGPPGPAGPRPFTLGAVRGGQVRRQTDKPRARLLQRRRSPRRRPPGDVVGRPQARPPSPPHLERAGRGGVPSAMSPRPARWRPRPDDLRGLLLPVTAASCWWAARIERAAAHVPPGGHPSSHHVTGHERRPAQRNKSERPRARTTQVTHCMRAPPAGAAAHGPLATAASQAKSQLREAPGGGHPPHPKAVQREGPHRANAIGAPMSSALQAGSSFSGRQRPPARMPTTRRRRTGGKALLGGEPP